MSKALHESNAENHLTKTFPLERYMFLRGGEDWKAGKRGAAAEANESLSLMSQIEQLPDMLKVREEFLEQTAIQGFETKEMFTAYTNGLAMAPAAKHLYEREKTVNTMQQLLLDKLNSMVAEEVTIDEALKANQENNEFMTVYNLMVVLNMKQEGINTEDSLHDITALDKISDALSMDKKSDEYTQFRVALGRVALGV